MRVEIAMQPWGQVLDEFDKKVVNEPAEYTTLADEPVDVFSDFEGDETLDPPLTDVFGYVMGFIESGTYKMTVAGITRIVEAISASDLGGGGGGGGTVGDAMPESVTHSGWEGGWQEVDPDYTCLLTIEGGAKANANNDAASLLLTISNDGGATGFVADAFPLWGNKDYTNYALQAIVPAGWTALVSLSQNAAGQQPPHDVATVTKQVLF